MVVKRLPKSLVRRIREYIRMQTFGIPSFGQMENADHRRTQEAATNLTLGTSRVRKMDVHRNYPGIPIILKQKHEQDVNAEHIVKTMRRIVDQHNRKYVTEHEYILQKPIGYAVSDDLIAMAKTDAPNIREILFYSPKNVTSRRIGEIDKTVRGKRVYDQLATAGDNERLAECAQRVIVRTKIAAHNILYLGKKNGKFIFVPLMDTR